jgi:hypothetical protein
VATLESTLLAPEPTPSSTEAPTAEEAALEFAQCMRDNGAEDFADPSGGADDKAGFKGDAGADDKAGLEAAYELCKELLEGTTGTKNAADDVGRQDELYDLAVCMRDNGFDMPDPNAAGDAYAELDKDDPKFLAAFGACDHVFGSSSTK